MNDTNTPVPAAPTNPDLAGSEARRIRERLTQAGLLVQQDQLRRRPDPAAVAQPRQAAAIGTELADLISVGRGGE